VQATLPDDVHIVGMAGRAELADMEAFVSELDVDSFPHLIDADGSLWTSLGVTSQPAFVFINDDGTASVHNGPLGEAELASRIGELRAR